MKILQVVTTYNQSCGIAFFASQLQEQMEKIGIEVRTTATLNDDTSAADVVLLQHHSELLNDESVIALCERSQCPVVLFAHSDGIDVVSNSVAGFVAMCPGIVPETDKPAYVFPHPAWVPECLEDRTTLRKRFGLPIKSSIIGTNGFLKFERQFTEILAVLLPYAKDNGWFVDLITSPWYIDSPGLISQLEELQSTYSACFRFEYSFWDKKTLNQKLQACDLLWCWTRAPSSPYASGVISDQYASGTRVFAADKLQHWHVLRLPNSVRGPNRLEPFIDQLILEIKREKRERHDPTLVSWDKCIDGLASLLVEIHSQG